VKGQENLSSVAWKLLLLEDICYFNWSIGSGKNYVSQTDAGILPPMTLNVETTKIHSVAGKIKDAGLMSPTTI
jgi:hypothetical protein